MIVMTSIIELESLFSLLFDEYFNEVNQVVSKSSVVTTADAFDKRQKQQDSTSSTSTLDTTVTTDGNFDFIRTVDSKLPHHQSSLKSNKESFVGEDWVGTSGGVFGNQGQASRSQAFGSQVDMVGSHAVTS
ncbi:hypothetical protein Tco_0677330 [Tanacetum coccineum]|uniref:Uncharacterized protein n=1 Tax=Tanacetum coccineum TaxID=301880 RepID=A0ABQ4XC42_9ASTR